MLGGIGQVATLTFQLHMLSGRRNITKGASSLFSRTLESLWFSHGQIKVPPFINVILYGIFFCDFCHSWKGTNLLCVWIVFLDSAIFSKLIDMDKLKPHCHICISYSLRIVI